jgi:Fe-S-cluster formation regulator IscX/YfhJ
MAEIGWTDTEEIGIRLMEAHPGIKRPLYRSI